MDEQSIKLGSSIEMGQPIYLKILNYIYVAFINNYLLLLIIILVTTISHFLLVKFFKRVNRVLLNVISVIIGSIYNLRNLYFDFFSINLMMEDLAGPLIVLVSSIFISYIFISIWDLRHRKIIYKEFFIGLFIIMTLLVIFGIILFLINI